MKKWAKLASIGSGSLLLLSVLFLIISSTWFLDLPFIPDSLRKNFRLNATIVPASDDSRSLFVAINPGFRAEFGDRDNPTSAFLRFEATRVEASSSAQVSGDIDRNLLDQFSNLYQALQSYQPGFSWQLFSVGLDETQVFTQTDLGQDEEVRRLTREILGQALVASASSDLGQVISEKKNVSTTTQVKRYQGYDVVENLAVAPDVDLQYSVLPAQGIKSEILIGDRQNFDTACLKLLSLTGSSQGCDLPSNRFSFLLELDSGQRLVHSPLSIDDSSHGTYYIVDEKNKFLSRLANPALKDGAGISSQKVNLEVRKGQISGQETDNFYILTIIADLNWLLDSQRTFPVTINSGFFVNHGALFEGENWQVYDMINP